MGLGKWLVAILVCYLWAFVLMLTAVTTTLGADYREVIVWVMCAPLIILVVSFIVSALRNR